MFVCLKQYLGYAIDDGQFESELNDNNAINIEAEIAGKLTNRENVGIKGLAGISQLTSTMKALDIL